uniref:Beta-hexosaminidase n=1 Tax=Timema bartmani TaxID=61472 RepID=A0A7R9I5H4_9NEOP|nr:unnamed protein product [Timema bartmani]
MTGILLATGVITALLAGCVAVETFGPLVKATVGQVWPKPQHQVVYDGYLVVRPSTFTFQVKRKTCDILEDALSRYSQVVRDTASEGVTSTGAGSLKARWRKDKLFAGYLDSLTVDLIVDCEEYPYLNMDEHYELRINSPDLENSALLTSQTIWGILRGLETFTHLLYLEDGGKAVSTYHYEGCMSREIANLLFRVNSTAITDYPRFSHRGLLLDTSRHYLPLSVLKLSLDAMAINKMNVLHWHIVDDQSFPYQSEAFPELSEKGAYNPVKYIYTHDDIRNITEYARLRGIRVVPEFDTPGHTLSWGPAVPNLLTPCYHDGEPDGTFGPIDPSVPENYVFLRNLFSEVVALFPDKYLHLGGDEVSFDCWVSNPNITAFMKNNNLSDYDRLEEYYVQKVVDISTQLGASAVVWQEVFDNGVILQNDTVVHVWTGNQETELAAITSKGYPALLSACWYLDHLQSGGDWTKFYECEPTDFDGTADQKRLVLGGEACMWAEVVDESNVLTRVWPRASATAEILWSEASASTETEVAQRLEEHYCRMKKRGIPSQPPNGPGFCP